MVVKIDGKTYYWTLEICRAANISRSTLLRRLKEGVLTKTLRDRRGWRLFSEKDLSVILAETGRTSIEEEPTTNKGEGKITLDTT